MQPWLLQLVANKTQIKRHKNEFNRMLHPTLLVVSFSQRAQPASCRTTQMDSFSSGLFQPTNSAGCNEFSRLFQPASSTVCRVTKVDSFSSRLCQTPNSSGCFSQRMQPAVSANEIKRSASMIVLSMAIVIVMFWRWRCFLFSVGSCAPDTNNPVPLSGC